MVEHVRTLEKKLSEWSRLRTADQPDGQRLQEIIRATEALSVAFQQSLARCATPDMLALQFNQYHHKVDRLIDRQAWPAPIRQALDRLLGELLDGRTALIDADRPLRGPAREHLQALVERQPTVMRTDIKWHEHSHADGPGNRPARINHNHKQ